LAGEPLAAPLCSPSRAVWLRLNEFLPLSLRQWVSVNFLVGRIDWISVSTNLPLDHRFSHQLFQYFCDRRRNNKKQQRWIVVLFSYFDRTLSWLLAKVNKIRPQIVCHVTMLHSDGSIDQDNLGRFIISLIIRQHFDR
jgi:hypothetical protein